MALKELESEAEKTLSDLKKLGFKAIKLQGRRPSGLKAAICYMIAKKRGWDNITRRQVAEIYGCTDVTVRNNEKLLKRIMEENRVKL